ncbi:SH3 domain-containing protein [Brevibacillus sp. FSL L8-0710]|uniref:SH3 domain-containing protein n=1 Tax=Brevibacillus sp. FSL L8-0710 TaxID=2975313 RepID=UPI0030F8D06F
MFVSSYRKSLWVRNALLVLFIIAAVGVVWKIGFSLYKVSLYEKARGYYEENNLLLAEETFSKANGITSIQYGDEAWSRSLSGLTTIRLELESLARQADAAIKERDDARMLAIYDGYHGMKSKYVKQQELQTVSFFKAISNRLSLESNINSYFLQAMELAKGALENNLVQKRYRNEESIASLAAIPDEYYGGTDKKKRELTRLFRSYDEAKFAHLTAAGSFPEVTASAANSLRAYKQASIQADWLVALLERYAKEEIRSAIRQDDLLAFIALAKAYREIRDVLPSRSEALDQIDRYISSKLRQAERYVDARQYEKAIELYRELNALEDTSTLIAEAESRWVDNEPVRLLREKYPDKAYRFVMSGESLWGSQVYAVGLTEDDDPQLYLAAKMPDGNVLYLEKSVGSGVAPSKLSLSEALGEKEAPLIFLEAQGKERTYLYTGFAPDLFSSRLAKVFEIEGEGFAAESPELIIVDNPTGEGEGEIAFFKLEEKGLVYEGKKDDYLSETAEGEDNASGETGDDAQDESQQDTPQDSRHDPQNQGRGDRTPTPGKTSDGSPAAEEAPPDIANAGNAIKMYAGPGEQYEQVGQIPANGSVTILTEADGWYQVSFEGKKGWINTVP